MHIRPLLNNSMQPSIHGTPAQGVKWLSDGFQSVDFNMCEFFTAAL